MHTIPKTLKDTLTASVIAMSAAYGISEPLAKAGCSAMFAELEGKGTRSITNQKPLDRVLSRKQAAEILGCSKKTISDKVKAGKLRAIYGGANEDRITGISEDSIRAYMEGRAK